MSNINYEEQILELEKQVVRSENKAVKLSEKLLELEQFPDIAKMNARLEFDLKIARQFVASKAFPNLTPEQAYVLMKAGEELGLTALQSLGSLYIVNGHVGFWGAGLVAQLTKKGVLFSYENETSNGVTVVAKYGDLVYKEVVSDSDPILQKSKAMMFAKKNKMRYHGVRMIASFYFAHFLNGIPVWEPDDYASVELVEKGDIYSDLKTAIENASSKEELENIMRQNKKDLTHPKHIDLLTMYGRSLKSFEL